MNETTIIQRIRLAVSRIKGVKLFRNNCGGLKDANGRFVQFGLHPGSGDLIGWTTIEIMPEHVGRKLAVFTSIEVKTPTGEVRPDQENWQRVVLEAGGKAIIARSEEQAVRMLENI